VRRLDFRRFGPVSGWEKGYVQHLLTKKELKAFNKLKSEQEAGISSPSSGPSGTPRPAPPQRVPERCESLAAQADEKFSTEK